MMGDVQIANPEQAAAWDGHEGDQWTEHAERYDRTGDRIWAHFLDAGVITEHDAVVDIGCGTGRFDAGRRSHRDARLGNGPRPVGARAAARAGAQRRRASDQRHVRAGRRAGLPVRSYEFFGRASCVRIGLGDNLTPRSPPSLFCWFLR